LVKCSKCGHEDGFIIWQSLNATLNPEAKADMMESCLFNQGLDDRIIELMKLFIRIDISQKNPEHEVDKIFFEY
jgi:hypothetical protein